MIFFKIWGRVLLFKTNDIVNEPDFQFSNVLYSKHYYFAKQMLVHLTLNI